MKTYTIPEKILVSEFSADVVVCGGGVAGVHAAIAAANEGCSVILVEQFGSVGGTASNGLVTPVMHSHIQGDPACSYITNILNERLFALGGLDRATKRVFDPTVLRVACEQLLVEAGVKILYYHFITDAIVENGVVKGVVVSSKSGTYVIEGKQFIDCTGDGDVSVLAGAEYTKGSPETGKCQPISLRYTVSGVDVNAFGEFINSEKSRTGVVKGADYSPNSVYAATTHTDDWTFTDLFNQAIANGDLITEDKLYWQVFTLPNRTDTLAFNNPEFFENTDGTNAQDLTQAQIQGKSAIYRQLAFYKKYMKGFENAYISEIASMVGIRESRNIVTDYVITAVDLLSRRKFEDSICQSNYPVDVHGKVLRCEHNVSPVDDGKPWYDIPFGSLVVKNFSNLFVAGRCLGAEFLAQSSIRVQQSCRASGEAAGIGASLAINNNRPSSEVDGVEVRAKMIALGAEFK